MIVVRSVSVFRPFLLCGRTKIVIRSQGTFVGGEERRRDSTNLVLQLRNNITMLPYVGEIGATKSVGERRSLTPNWFSP